MAGRDEESPGGGEWGVWRFPPQGRPTTRIGGQAPPRPHEADAQPCSGLGMTSCCGMAAGREA
jgi:hypothetical protein